MENQLTLGRCVKALSALSILMDISSNTSSNWIDAMGSAEGVIVLLH